MATLQVTTWSLEMRSAPASAPLPTPASAALRRELHPPLPLYRHLYGTVGRPWRWIDRARLDDAALAAIVHDPRVEIWVADSEASLAGFAELDRRVPGEVELAYLGLVPERIGRGLGPWLLDAAIRRAWALEPIDRLWVHTCSLDHPAARRTYERAGFVVYDVREHTQDDPADP